MSKAKFPAVEPIEIDDLEKMHTGSLLARLKRLQRLHETFECSDWTEQEKDARAGMICFKDTSSWHHAMSDLRSVLGKREHIERGSKAKRQQLAWEKKYR